jgi:hypothetical protein
VFLGRIESSITISLDRELGSSILGRVGVEVGITIGRGVGEEIEISSLLDPNIGGELLIFRLIGISTLARSLGLGYSYYLIFYYFSGHLLEIVRCPPL